ELGESPLTNDSLHRLPILAAAIREAGRLQSPVLLLPRGVINDFEFNGRFVPSGTHVYVAIAGGHRLASVFEDPNRFDPDRFLPPREEDRRNPYALATFGGGPRICLGINFAQLEVMTLAAYVRRTYHWSRRRPCETSHRSPASSNRSRRASKQTCAGLRRPPETS